jgi:hypothetical protein
MDDELVSVHRSDIRFLVELAADWPRRDEEQWERCWRLAGFERDPQFYHAP